MARDQKAFVKATARRKLNAIPCDDGLLDRLTLRYGFPLTDPVSPGDATRGLEVNLTLPWIPARPYSPGIGVNRTSALAGPVNEELRQYVLDAVAQADLPGKIAAVLRQAYRAQAFQVTVALSQVRTCSGFSF